MGEGGRREGGREEGGREGRSLVEILEKEQGLDQGKEREPRPRDPLTLITFSLNVFSPQGPMGISTWGLRPTQSEFSSLI